ncbi:terminase small subunit [Gordonia phage Dardanus]|uniref:Terminase small subunit n=1 Tax=Gordonia phage Dardanus TaxID=2588489 RepID=A0A514CX02_9CAUD|nr:hypothetical protein KDJ58_gp08 [Gordonia phage Dardanus]QDH85045.1 terminase small subunit [Gordonia phage Dardanus]
MGQLLDSVNESVGRMAWLQDADKAALALARAYAEQIDAVVDGEGGSTCPECGAETGPDATAITKALYLGPHLLNALRALGATPDGRAALDVTQPTKGALSGIRNRSAARGGAKP